MSAKRVVLHSFHSQAADTIASDESSFDLVLCVDGHLDYFMSSAEQSQNFPDKIVRLAADRASAHSFIRRATGDFPPLLSKEDRMFLAPMYVVVPLQSAMASAEVLVRRMKAARKAAAWEAKETPLNLIQGLLKDTLGIGLYLSRPRQLKKFLTLLRDADEPLMDIDIDYFHEFQSECYSPLVNAASSDLGSVESVLRLIRKTRPRLITVSEAKLSALRNPQSNVSALLNIVKRMGYVIEERLLESDKQAEDAIATYAEYYKTVVETTSISLDNLMERAKILGEATKIFFDTQKRR